MDQKHWSETKMVVCVKCRKTFNAKREGSVLSRDKEKINTACPKCGRRFIVERHLTIPLEDKKN